MANAGLLLPATLAQHLGLPELVQQCLDLGRAPGRANAGDKMMTLIASALAGGDSIDDAGGTAGVLDCMVKAPSSLGTFLRSFRWGHVRQLDRVSRELLARAWQVGAGPGEVLMCRLREGRANTARGAAHFLRETVGRVRYGGTSGQLTLRAASGFYIHSVASVCRKLDVRFSITIRQHKSLRNLIEAIPEDAWTPIPYWMDGAADVAETSYRACLKSQEEGLGCRLWASLIRGADKMPLRDMDREQMWLLPPSLDELLPLDHPARFVAEFVDGLDREGWAELGVETEGDPLGAPAYHPRALLCVWLYGFMNGLRSCRKLEAACRDQIPYLWLTGWQHPDHNTLWRFYKAHRQAMRELFKRTVRTAVAMELVDLAVQAVDGVESGSQRHERQNL